MLKMRRIQKTLAILISVLMICILAACGSSNNTDSDSTAKDNGGDSTVTDDSSKDVTNEPITLTLWNTEVPTPGIQKNDVAEEIARLTGITMDIIQGDAQKFKVLVAGNDLPDIIYTNPAQQQVETGTLIEGGQIIPMDDLIEQYGENIKKNFPIRLEYARKFLSNGQDKVYFLPVLCYKGDPEKPDISYTIAGVGNMIRWDIYAKIGYPEVKTTDDFLNVLKQMQDAYPVTEEGNKVYAISGWNDWGIWPWFVSNTQEHGLYGYPNNILFNRVTGESTISYNDERFWDSIAFFNKAYRMGILDPEAFTMKADNFWEKAQRGQVLMAYASWQTNWINKHFVSDGHPERGFAKIPHDGNPYVEGIVSPDYPLGSAQDYANAITVNCEHPERALQLLDLFNSDEGARLIYSGIKGKHWDVVGGEPQPTDEFIHNSINDPDHRTKTGTILYNKFAYARDIQVLEDGYPADLMRTNKQKAKNVLPIDKEYTKYYGDYSFPGEVLADMWKQGKVETFTKFWLHPLLVQPPSDDTKKIMAQIDEYMKVQITRTIMAESDEDFEAQKKKAMEDIRAMGFDKAEADLLDSYKKAEEEAKTFPID